MNLAQHLATALGEPHRAGEIAARIAQVPRAADFAERLLAIAGSVDALLALQLEDLVLAHRAIAG
ncbi:MAG: hypothetical protein KIT31_35955, partial [Deltaproteobacteria bacterium]|nr:hypothetical protein [Deltaproteobacteria bacterium]